MPKFSDETIRSWTGYDPDHLEHGSAMVDRPTTAVDGVMWLDYIHYSVLMDRKYRQPLVAALNIDQASLVSVKRNDDWDTDPRIPDEYELHDGIYRGSGYSRGHMAMRSNAAWGEDAQDASDATFYFPNSCPQKQSFNGDEWLRLEKWVGGSTHDTTDKISVFSGPIFASRTPKIHSPEPMLRGIEVPIAFYKIVCYIGNTGILQTRAYIVPTEEAAYTVLDENASHIDESFHTGSLIYQVSVAEIEEMTRLSFPSQVAASNPIRRGERFAVRSENDVVVDPVEDPRRPYADEPLVRIISAMPKPSGGGHAMEWITIQNLGDGDVSLANLTLSDNSGIVDLKSLKDSLGYGECLTIHNEELGGIKLSNKGELLSLKNGNMILHQVRYMHPETGRAVLFS